MRRRERRAFCSKVCWFHFDDTIIKMMSLFFPHYSFLFFSTRRILCLFVVFCLLKNNLGEKSLWEKKFKKKKTPTFFSALLLDKKRTGSENNTRQHY